jgi:hypothetical protein
MGSRKTRRKKSSQETPRKAPETEIHEAPEERGSPSPA